MCLGDEPAEDAGQLGISVPRERVGPAAEEAFPGAGKVPGRPMRDTDHANAVPPENGRERGDIFTR